MDEWLTFKTGKNYFRRIEKTGTLQTFCTYWGDFNNSAIGMCSSQATDDIKSKYESDSYISGCKLLEDNKC